MIPVIFCLDICLYRVLLVPLLVMAKSVHKILWLGRLITAICQCSFGFKCLFDFMCLDEIAYEYDILMNLKTQPDQIKTMVFQPMFR